MWVRRFVAAAVCGAGFFSSPAAWAWQEAHVVADDVRVVLEPEGRARFEHATQVTVTRGPYRGFDLAPVDGTAIVEPQTTCRSDSGVDYAATAMLEGETLHVRLDDPKAIRKGKLTCATRYSLDAASRELLVVERGIARFTWTAPRSPEGFDTAKMTVSLPAAATEPAAVNPETGEIDRTVVTSLGRLQERDELQMTRPHIPRAGSARWAVRFDARAVTVAPRATPPPVDSGHIPSKERRHFWWFAVALAFAFSALVVGKDRVVRRRGDSGPVPLVRGPVAIRSAIGGALVMLASWFAARDAVGFSGLSLALATCSLIYRVRPLVLHPRAPGHWFILKPADAFKMPHGPRDAFNLRGMPGGLLLLAIVMVAIAFSLASYRAELPSLFLVGLGVPLIALSAFVSGGASQHLPSPKQAALALAPVYRALVLTKDLRVVPWARMPTSVDGQESEPDEMRLLLMPQPLMPGLRGIEVAVSFSVSMTHVRSHFELLVRTVDGSKAHEVARALFAGEKPAPGRRADERVWTLNMPDQPGFLAKRVQTLTAAFREERALPAANGQPLRQSA